MGLLLACSGEGAGETIARNIQIGYSHAGIAGGLLVVAGILLLFNPKWWLFPSICLALFLLHPAWTVSAIHGDCGFLKRDASWAFTALACATLVLQFVSLAAQGFGKAKPGATAAS